MFFKIVAAGGPLKRGPVIASSSTDGTARKRQATMQLASPEALNVQEVLSRNAELELLNLELRRTMPLERVRHMAALAEQKRQNAELRAANEALTAQLQSMGTQLESAQAQLHEMTRQMNGLIAAYTSWMPGPAQPLAVQPSVAQPPLDQQPAVQPPAAPGQWWGYPAGYAGATGFGWPWGAPHS